MQASVHDLDYNHKRQLAATIDPVTDEQLLIEYRQTGDRELFAQLVYRYERKLYRYLRRYLGSTEAAEDAFQQTFLHAHLRAGQFQSGRRFQPWLFGIATNAAIDYLRRNKRHGMLSLDAPRTTEAGVKRLVDLLESEELGPEDSAKREEAGRLLREAINRLPEAQSALIHLIYYQGMSYRDVAEALEIPVGTVKSRMHAAVHKLASIVNSSQVD